MCALSSRHKERISWFDVRQPSAFTKVVQNAVVRHPRQLLILRLVAMAFGEIGKPEALALLPILYKYPRFDISPGQTNKLGSAFTSQKIGQVKCVVAQARGIVRDGRKECS